jgi:hypothetical protein
MRGRIIPAAQQRSGRVTANLYDGEGVASGAVRPAFMGLTQPLPRGNSVGASHSLEHLKLCFSER